MTTKQYQSAMADIKTGKTFIIDGATGTELQRRGAKMEREAWCALATESHPETLREIHADYIKAGARLITANTFASSKEILKTAGLENKFVALNKQSVEIAVEARERSGYKNILVAGSITQIVPGGGDHGTLTPTMSSPQQFEADCTEMAAIHKAAGCDLILAEMLGDRVYAPCIIRAARANDLPVWVGLSAYTNNPDAPDVLTACASNRPLFAEGLAAIIEAGGDVYGVMHTDSDITGAALNMLKQHWSGPLMAYPDSVPKRTGEVTDLDLSQVISEDVFTDYCRDWNRNGVQILGGCCGLTVSHIRALSKVMTNAVN